MLTEERIRRCFSWLRLLGPVIYYCLIPGLQAQPREYIDVIHLHSGEVYRGYLQASSDSSILTLETLCYNKRIFPVASVLEITQTRLDHRSLPFYRTMPERGYFNRTDLGALIGTGNNEQDYILSIQMVNGYRVTHRFYPGLGMGIEFYEYAMAPLYADFSYVMLLGSMGVFFRGSIGHAFPLEQPGEEWGISRVNHGGSLYAAGTGVKFGFPGGNALSFTMMYRFQCLKSSYSEQWTDEVRNLEMRYNRLSLRIGLIFE